MISYFTIKRNLNICEDSLTSSIFDLLKYLPTEIFWRILKKSLYHDILPSYCGEFLSFNYWVKWNPKGTNNVRYIEPDIFIEFEHFNLIIEAKSRDRNQQNKSQQDSQIEAYFNEYKNYKKTLYYIQMGGLNDINQEINNKYNNAENENKPPVLICKTDWSSLLEQIIKEKEKYKTINSANFNSYNRILDDLIKAFNLHGFYKSTWLSEMNLDITINNFEIKDLFNYARR